MKRLYVTILLLATAVCMSYAQVKVTLQSPRQAEVGQRIRVSYIANTTDVEDIQVGEFPGFEVLYGPSTSTSRSMSIVNGNASQSATMTFTYTLLATEAGNHQIPAATVVVDGKSYKSQSTGVEVLPSSSNDKQADDQGNDRGNGANQRQGKQAQVKSIGDSDLYMTVTASKKEIFEQEAVLITYKLYSLVNIQQLAGEIPQLDGCHVQELDSKAQMSLKYERVNGRNYATGIWRQYVLYPQKTGKLTIPSTTFDSQIEVRNTTMDPFDIFFGGGSLTQLVSKKIVTPAIDIDVKPLPSPRPDNFSGAVGKLSVSATLSPEQINANDAATLKLVVSGVGNMKLMKAPKINFPQDFEIYDPKETDKTTNTASGAKGNFVYDYVIVPRHGGKYSIAPVEFVYFDTESKQYQTLHTDSFSISVAKPKGGSQVAYREQEDLKIIDNDIRFIKLGDAKSDSPEDSFLFSVSYWAIYACLIVTFIVLILVFNRQIKEKANVARHRGRRAGKAAVRRLANAAKLMKRRESGPFYDEVMKALLGYASDKLNIPTSGLNKDNVSDKLVERGVEESLVREYMDVLSECEFARYAPGDPEATMDKIYSRASEVINKMDNIIRKTK